MEFAPINTRPVYCNHTEDWPVIEVVRTEASPGWRGVSEAGHSAIVNSPLHLPSAPLLTGDPEYDCTWLIEDPLVVDPVETLARPKTLRFAGYEFLRGTPDLFARVFHLAAVGESRLALSITHETVYALDADGRGCNTDSLEVYSPIMSPSAAALKLLDAAKRIRADDARVCRVHTRIMPDLDALLAQGHWAVTKALDTFAKTYCPSNTPSMPDALEAIYA